MRVVIEPTIERHTPQLYHSQNAAVQIEGFEGVGAEQIQRYQRDGYLVIKQGLSPEEVRSARGTLAAMTRAEDPSCESVYYEGAIREYLPGRELAHQATNGDVQVEQLALGDLETQLPNVPADIRARYVRKFAGFTKSNTVLGEIARKPSMLNVIRQLVQGPVKEFQDMAMIKPPLGREKPWHQDHAYFNLPLETRVVGVWIALDHVTPENGCMYVIPGGHNQGPRPHFLRRDWQICDTEMLGSPSTYVEMSPGDMLLFDSKLPHGTPTNTSNEYRWAIQLHYTAADASEVDERVRLDHFGNEGKNVSC